MFCFDWWLRLFVAVVKYTSKLLLLIFLLILLLSLLRFYLLLQFSGIETTSIFIMYAAHSTFLNLLFGTWFWRVPLFLQHASYLQGLILRSLPWLFFKKISPWSVDQTNCPWSCTRCWGWYWTSCKWMVPFCNICHKSCVAIGSGWPGVPGGLVAHPVKVFVLCNIKEILGNTEICELNGKKKTWHRDFEIASKELMGQKSLQNWVVLLIVDGRNPAPVDM